MSCRVQFYFSSAGIAGDPHKLLVAIDVNSGSKIMKSFNRSSPFIIFRLRRLRKKMLKEFEILCGSKPEVI
jgi:hypothetical protein